MILSFKERPGAIKINFDEKQKIMHSIDMAPKALKSESLDLEVNIFWKETESSHCHIFSPGSTASSSLTLFEH